jgi:hypothetical protein
MECISVGINTRFVSSLQPAPATETAITVAIAGLTQHLGGFAEVNG